MAKIRWVNFIHIYQPPWQDAVVLHRVVRESYSFIVGLLLKHPALSLSLNITGSLIELLEEHGHIHIISALRSLYQRGQIEITGSAYSHAFLPQLPDHEITRQIALQEQVLRARFPRWQPRGFFLPEMAYSTRAGRIIKERGYTWIILDPTSTKLTPDAKTKYIDRKTGLTVIFRNRLLSKSYPPEELYKMSLARKDMIVISATDGELYGHFHKDWQKHFEKVIKSGTISTERVSDYLKTLSTVQPLYLRSASWETRDRSIRTNNPFSIWYNTANPIHRLLWKLAHTAIAALQGRQKDPNFTWARKHLDRGLASCSWWWASGVKTSPFAPIGWSPDETEKGARELIKSIRSLKKIPAPEKIYAEKLYHDLLLAIWQRHWNSYGAK